MGGMGGRVMCCGWRGRTGVETGFETGFETGGLKYGGVEIRSWFFRIHCILCIPQF